MILVTGGAGFIGSNIVAALAERGAAVVVCDRLGHADQWRNLAKHDVREIVPPQALAAWLEQRGDQVETIVHMGAISSTVERDADLILENNFALSSRLWDWCAHNRKRMIYASSAATYGSGADGFDDDGSPGALARLRPLNAYGWSKHLFDRRVARSVEEGAPRPAQWVGLKFFNVYGPNEYHKQDMQSVIARKFPAAVAGETVTLFRSDNPEYPDGGQQRDFVYVRDCVEVVLWMLDSPKVNGLFNLGTGRARSFGELAEAVFRTLNKTPRIEYVDMPAAIRDKYQYFTEARMSRLRDAGFTKDFTSLEDGVGDYVERFLNRADRYR